MRFEHTALVIPALVIPSGLGMSFLKSLNIRSKLILLLLLVSILAAGVTGWLGYRSGERNLTKQIFAQLTALAEVASGQIEQYFDLVEADVRAMGSDPTLRNALEAFSRASGEVAALTEEQEAKLAEFYNKEFLPKLSIAENAHPVAESFLPASPQARALQYHYIASNPSEIGQKETLINANDGSEYSAVHAQFHPFISTRRAAFDYSDIFLINADGRIVYSAFKEVDYQTDLVTGPYNETGLARAFRRVKQERGSRPLVVEDYSFYMPSFGAPAMFMATPIFRGGNFLGVVAIQVSSSRVSDIANFNGNWEKAGLGKTGEVFVVGSDTFVRSKVRTFMEDRAAFIADARARGADSGTLSQMQAYDTPILLQRARSAAVMAAIKGETSIRIVPSDYKGRRTLAASTPMALPGLDWVMVAEMPTDEALAPIRLFQREVIVSVVLLSIASTLIAMIMSRLFTKPLRKLIDRAHKVIGGDLSVDMTLSGNDEFSELSHDLQGLVHNLRNRTDEADKQRAASENLLGRFLPEGVVRRLSQIDVSNSERFNIHDVVQNATFIYGKLSGYEAFLSSLPPDKAVGALDQLVEMVDLAAERHGVEKVRTVGASYFAISGLSTPHLDHDRRGLAFARDLVAIIKRFRRETGVPLEVKVGISTGNALSGVIGKDRLVFDLWGEPVVECEALNEGARPGEIRISLSLAKRLGEDVKTIQPANSIGLVALADEDESAE